MCILVYSCNTILLVKMSKLMIHSKTCMNSKSVILSEISQTWKTMHCNSIYKNTRIDITRRFSGNQKMVATLRLKTEYKDICRNSQEWWKYSISFLGFWLHWCICNIITHQNEHIGFVHFIGCKLYNHKNIFYK